MSYYELGETNFRDQEHYNEGVNTEFKSVHELIKNIGEMLRESKDRVAAQNFIINEQTNIINILSSKVSFLERHSAEIIHGGNYGNRNN